MDTLIDNDVLFKGSCYGLLAELAAGVCPVDHVGVLGAAWFVVSKKIARTTLKKDSGALSNLRSFLESVKTIEPTEAEQSLAAEFELAAQRLAVSLDAGESQLCAVLISRKLRLLVTGDKRAIAAIDQLLESDDRMTYLCSRVCCLEQLALIMLSDGKGTSLRKAICEEPSIDTALSICFSCTSGSGNDEGFRAGLESYIADLRSKAKRVLVA